ncbi:hypothetical protein NQ318_012559 [Aromia moschata]|uniref:Uncharacterized protein n=1 Tax=Aromia moschata TaxID=1265417 RepID=A0AAV8YK77_9CUCU|nr:hypothetical protein NQ318_012559 [Aromia moschata]
MLPSLNDCKILKQGKKGLDKRSPQQIRLWVQNQINKNRKPCNVQRWTTPEKRVIKEVFGKYIDPDCSVYPSAEEIRDAVSTHKEIENRTPRKIKSPIQHLKKLKAVSRLWISLMLHIFSTWPQMHIHFHACTVIMVIFFPTIYFFSPQLKFC